MRNGQQIHCDTNVLWSGGYAGGTHRVVDEVVWVKMTVNRRLAKSHGYYLQHAKEVLTSPHSLHLSLSLCAAHPVPVLPISPCLTPWALPLTIASLASLSFHLWTCLQLY